MRQRLNSTDLSIEELMAGRYEFSIPAYQRDYTWTKDEAIQLLDDLAAVIEDVERDGARTPYFLGSMLFVETPGGRRGEACRAVEVVDGQQRLITLNIALAVLRDLADSADAAELDKLISAPAVDGAEAFHLSLRSADDAFFKTAIQRFGATRRSQPVSAVGESVARRNIEEVRRAIRSKLQRELSVEARRELAAFICRNTRVLVVASDDFDYAYQIFLTINDRGKRLSVEDIFRGEILGPLDREQRERFESIIDEMEKYRDEAESTRTKGKTFFSHLAAIDGWPRRGIIEGLKLAVERIGGPRRFVAEVFAPMAESYLQIKRASGARVLPDAAGHWLTVLRWLEHHGDDDWVAAAMVGLRRYASDPELLIEFLRHLDRYAHALMALGCGREARRRHYAPILRRLIDDKVQPDPSQLLAITPANQKAILRNIATRLHLIDPPTTRLVLLRVDQALSGRPLAFYQPLIERDRRDPERFTVEHICPKGEVRDGEWLVLFPRKTVRQRAAQCIGNLALVAEAQNKRGNQKDFAAKKQLFFPDAQPSPMLLTQMLSEVEVWDGAAISRRYGLIMQTIKDLWMLEGAIPLCPALGPVATIPAATEAEAAP